MGQTRRSLQHVLAHSPWRDPYPWWPAGVTVHCARMLLDQELTAAAVLRMDREEGMHAVEQLVSCRPASIAYCCTASSIVQGLKHDDVLIEEISRIAGVPAVTATRSIMMAADFSRRTDRSCISIRGGN